MFLLLDSSLFLRDDTCYLMVATISTKEADHMVTFRSTTRRAADPRLAILHAGIVGLALTTAVIHARCPFST